MQLTMVMGLDGSGREEVAREQDGLLVHNENDAIKALYEGYDVVLEAPNLRTKTRKSFLQRVEKLDCVKKVILTAQNYENCVAAAPDRAEHIRGQYLGFYPPMPYEGWDEIELRYAEGAQFVALPELFFGKDGLVFLQQDNPHHIHSVGIHCIRAARYVAQHSPDPAMQLASLLHDIGKGKTKVFMDAKGNPSAIAHFYGHEFASSYDSLFVRFPKAVEEAQRLRVSALIVWHMMPRHFEGNDKARERYARMWGEEFLRDMLLIERADREAQH